MGPIFSGSREVVWRSSVKVGDLVKVTDKGCETHEPQSCICWFCYNESNGYGIILEKLSVGDGLGYWSIMFDVGEWRLYGSEMKVINESR
jgi:hypothetical protein